MTDFHLVSDDDLAFPTYRMLAYSVVSFIVGFAIGASLF